MSSVVRMPSAFAVSALLVGVFAASAAAGYRVPWVRMPLMAKAPVVDGRVDEAEWAGAARMERFGRQAKLAPLEASFWVGCDGRELFLAVVSETPPGGKLLARFAPLPNDADARTWLDDSVELVLDPLRHDTTGRRRLYHANLNARGAINDTAYRLDGGGEAWRGHWRIANQIIGDRWHFEAALPLADLGLTEADLARPIGIRICRNWHQTPLAQQTEWSPLGGAYLAPETMPLVSWDPAAPVVQVVQLVDAASARPHVKLTVFNPSPRPLDVVAHVKLTPKSSLPQETRQTLSVPPGQTIPLELTAATAQEELETLIRVTSRDERTVYYQREFAWRADRPAAVWTADRAAARRIQTQFAYYPSFRKVHFQLDLSGFEERARVTGARLELRRKGDKVALAAHDLPVIKAAARVWWDVPALTAGEYEAVLTLAGASCEPVVQPFVRHVFPWEGNSLGKSEVVIEPFTPIRVEGRRVSTVLRQHTLDGLGLWEQVESLGQPLLAEPMRLEVTVGERRETVRGELKMQEQAGHRVRTEATWTGGPLKGSAHGVWDYDGLLKWTLHIEPCAQPIEALTLIIPLRDRLMPLFHPCTDGLRFNYAGTTPAGEGRVWDGTKAARNSILGNYVPYIWLGAEERGLAVFGENDKGWVTDPKIPCQELTRRGELLELRLNLIAKPTTIAQPRQILLGFQATPTKPLPTNWRLWSESYATQLPPGGKKITFNGSCWTWGALTPCLDVYPRDEDLTLWDEFAKTKRTGVVDQVYLERWLAGYANKTPEERDLNRNNINYAFHILKSRPTDVLAYTNARGVRLDTREGQTFLDEWHRDAFTTRDWPPGGGVAYDLNPGASFRDYALWYYQRMCDTFVDHIYWDDIFLQSCFDTVGSEAYELPDGNIQPAAGLFDMRELIRRTAVLMHERGRRGTAGQVHITNTALAPILSFAGTHLTWEDRAGDADFQDRFSRDYIRTESLGRQHGNVPFVLLLIHGPDPAKLAWARRTCAGVMLVHEIKPIGVLDDYEKNIKTLYDFGYGVAATRVFNYWDPEVPVTVSRPDAVALVVTKPGSALVLACDYGAGGEATLALDLARLGMRGPLRATDTESNAPLDVSADSRVQCPLKKHDFRLIRIEGQVP